MPLVLTKRPGRPNWYLRGTVRGIFVSESTKTADAAAAETIRILRERELLDESIFGKKLNITFADAVKAYLANDGSNQFIAPLLGTFAEIRLRNITQHDLDAAALSLYPATAPATRNRQCYTPFIAVWNYAVKNGWAEMRMWQRPRKKKGTKSRTITRRSGTRPVDYDRAAMFVSQMSPAPAMVMTALFYTGMRPIELFMLEATDVDVDRRWIVIGNSKTGEPRGVPMHEILAPLFRSLVKRRDSVPQLFRSYRGWPYKLHEERGCQLHGALRGTRERLAKAGSPIFDVSPYTARHTVSTQLVINGVHPHIKDQILGHAVDDMSRHYTNVPQAPLIEAINTLPVPKLWRSLAWWRNPLLASRRHIKWGAK